ncbi:MAG: N,N-dimethylformamidase [Gammaproteobacteria bacterium]
MREAQQAKAMVAYVNPLSLRAGEHIELKASSHRPATAKLDLVRIICGDPTRTGPGFKEIEIDSPLPATIDVRHQAIIPGSFGEVDLSGIHLSRRLAIEVHVRATAPRARQTVLSVNGANGHGIELQIRGGTFTLCIASGVAIKLSEEIDPAKWYRLALEIDFRDHGTVVCEISPLQTRSPGRDLLNSGPHEIRTSFTAPPPGALLNCLFAASISGERFDGRVSHPIIQIDDVSLEWDFSEDISGRKLAEVSGNQRHGLIYQLPARAVTGPQWDGTYHDWKSCPQHYDAVHFHSDDLYDVDWSVSASLELPRDLASGIYGFRLTTDSEIERTPFFVRPAGTKQASNVALLMPSCTYMAYANHRMLIEGANFVAARSRLRPEHEYIRDHPEIGPSMYEKHRDGSGVMYSSRHRPILQLHPGADGWNFTPDTDINAFMTTLDLNHDVITDEDLHADGFAALSTYKVLVTGSHPEYWSTAMLDALEQWLRNGGRLLYLGGNGFYWRVAFSDAWPGAIELRRAEDGVRNWQTETGESYHSFNGEYGGMWRRLGRAPNELVGVGFAAQGFERAIGYRRSSASYDPRTAWIFDGVDEQHIGVSGLGGGAAGQEVDSYNPDLGSPTHAVILASATEFGPDMSRTKEELQASILVPSPDPVVRADMVFFETPAGGAVFSVGSISWFGALARNGYDNDIAKITENVLRRFLDPEEFPCP